MPQQGFLFASLRGSPVAVREAGCCVAGAKGGRSAEMAVHTGCRGLAARSVFAMAAQIWVRAHARRHRSSPQRPALLVSARVHHFAVAAGQLALLDAEIKKRTGE